MGIPLQKQLVIGLFVVNFLLMPKMTSADMIDKNKKTLATAAPQINFSLESLDSMILNSDVIAIVNITSQDKDAGQNLWKWNVVESIKGKLDPNLLICAPSYYFHSDGTDGLYPPSNSGLNITPHSSRIQLGQYLAFLQIDNGCYTPYGGPHWKYSLQEILGGEVQWPEHPKVEKRNTALIINEITNILSQKNIARKDLVTPVERWSLDLDGYVNVNAQPVIFDDIIIINLHDKEYKSWHLEARHLSDQTLIWTKNLKTSNVFGPIYNGNIIVSLNKEIIALNILTGKEQWHFSLPVDIEKPKHEEKFSAEGQKPTLMYSGFTSPAALDDDKLYIGDENIYSVRSVGPSNFYCLDASSGKLLWSIEIPSGVDRCPVSFDKKYIYVIQDYGFTCISKEERRIMWSSPYISTIRASAYPINKFVIVPGFGLQCLSVNDGELLWAIVGSRNDYAGKLIDGVLYTSLSYSENEHYFAAIQAETGEIIWQSQFADDVRGGATVEGDNIYITTFGNNLYCLDRIKGNIRWQYPIKLDTWGPMPILTKDGILLAFGNKLVCIKR